MNEVPVNAIIKINLDQIFYIKGLKDYVKIILKGSDKAFLSLMSLKSLEQQLPTERFMRIHRLYIINLSLINHIERNRVIINSTRITIADIYKEKFMKYIESRSMNSWKIFKEYLVPDQYRIYYCPLNYGQPSLQETPLKKAGCQESLLSILNKNTDCLLPKGL